MALTYESRVSHSSALHSTQPWLKCPCCCHAQAPKLPRHLRRKLRKDPGRKVFGQTDFGVFEYQAHYAEKRDVTEKKKVVFTCRQLNSIGMRFPTYEKGHRQVRSCRRPPIHSANSSSDDSSSDTSVDSDEVVPDKAVGELFREFFDQHPELIGGSSDEPEFTTEEIELLAQLNDTTARDPFATVDTPNYTFEIDLFSAVAMNMLNYGHSYLLRKLECVRQEMQQLRNQQERKMAREHFEPQLQKVADGIMEQMRQDREQERLVLQEQLQQLLREGKDKRRSKKTCFTKADPLGMTRIRCANGKGVAPSFAVSKKRRGLKKTDGLIKTDAFVLPSKSTPQDPVGPPGEILTLNGLQFTLVRQLPGRIWAAIAPTLYQFQELQRALVNAFRLCKSSAQSKKAGVEKLQGHRSGHAVYCLRHPKLNTRLLATAVKIADLIGNKPLDDVQRFYQQTVRTQLPPHGRFNPSDLILIFDSVSKHAILNKDKIRKATKKVRLIKAV